MFKIMAWLSLGHYFFTFDAWHLLFIRYVKSLSSYAGTTLEFLKDFMVIAASGKQGVNKVKSACIHIVPVSIKGEE